MYVQYNAQSCISFSLESLNIFLRALGKNNSQQSCENSMPDEVF